MEIGQWIDLAFSGTPRRHGRHVGKGYSSAPSVFIRGSSAGAIWRNMFHVPLRRSALRVPLNQ